MKKSFKLKIAELTAAAALSFLIFSCATAPASAAATAPVSESSPETAQTETSAEQENSNQANQAEEQQPEQETTASETETPDTTDITSETEEPEIPAEEKVEDELLPEPEVTGELELIEDIPGYYESDPEPVFLEPSDKNASEKNEIEKNASEKNETEKTLTDTANENKSDEENLITIEISDADKNKTEKTVTAETKNPQAEKTEVQVVPQASDTAVVLSPENKTEPAAKTEITQTTNKNEKTETIEGITAAEEVEASELLSAASEPEENENQENSEENKITVVPSRSVQMKNSQYLDIVYPGTGWIYLGETDNKNLMRYFGRKIGESNTVFSLRSREEGNTILHFYKNDQLTGKFIDDYLQVEITGTNNTTEHAVAPSYAEIVPARPEKKIITQPVVSDSRKIEENKKTAEIAAAVPKASVSAATASAAKTVQVQPSKNKKTQSAAGTRNSVNETAEDNGSKTVIQEKTSDKNTDSEKAAVPQSENSAAGGSSQAENSTAQKEASVSKASIENTENMAADEILEKAKESFKNKKYEDTLAYLDDFFAKATTKIDEGLMLQGQTFESNSSVRNIKSALDTYETIVRRYPQSIHWAKANERITYLRKFYFNIR